jgi:hypothetical protein
MEVLDTNSESGDIVQSGMKRKNRGAKLEATCSSQARDAKRIIVRSCMGWPASFNLSLQIDVALLMKLTAAGCQQADFAISQVGNTYLLEFHGLQVPERERLESTLRTDKDQAGNETTSKGNNLQ